MAIGIRVTILTKCYFESRKRKPGLTDRPLRPLLAGGIKGLCGKISFSDGKIKDCVALKDFLVQK